ncbi:hypothetical protein PC129_g19505 [Phytophthora cactorum]|uniref:Uncharacterized protein n=1 Tax=Phytophthora cactorum TaxID=29920 RepID=A0A8T1EZF4_9STRA|nr:hypothetical protein Pcac1_g28261 [Phytophthora cactorum]KAG2796201.1 hypothetical protein PC111_g21828 [Phytophthora cactorum]KAG2796517.1 hypothetical protein PC112_g22171 [Phytophthora cactorum]KAG2827633.1 hypothetical protein PC113_g21596 [Phytophthora cactorum]KAG2875347.1 hypothetical protein PC114_g24776 [Phytophthora cactorum]
MPSPHTWNLLCSGVSSEDAAVLLQGMKKWKTVKSQLMSCTSSSSGAPHSMRYRLLVRVQALRLAAEGAGLPGGRHRRHTRAGQPPFSGANAV